MDEVTAVGDQRFKRKSRAVFADRMKSASAILVSHNLEELREFCDAAILLDKGRLTLFDDLAEAVAQHRRIMA